MKNYQKSILITGASSGIGESLALAYAGPHVFLALSGRNIDRLENVAKYCRLKGADVEVSLVNVTDEMGMAHWIKALDDKNPLDLVIASAGISGGTGGTDSGEPFDQAREIFNVNIIGVLNTLSPIVPRMIKRKNGQVAIISSMAGFRGFPTAPAYSASKGAVRFYGEGLRGALSPYNVKINVVCPGFVKSRMTDANDFPMPFLMNTEKAVHIIIDGLERNVGRIAFPFPIHIISWFLSILPDFLAQKILNKLPAKGQISKK